MTTANNTIKTRIQLKSDIEANWNNSELVPLLGELIVYTADANHSFSRIKIGDGATAVTQLPFIDAGSLNGDAEIIRKFNSFNSFPQIGSTKCLYLDISTGQLYHYDTLLEYLPIADISLNTTSSTVKEVTFWNAGQISRADIENNVLVLQNGSIPQLSTQNTTVLTGVQIGGNN